MILLNTDTLGTSSSCKQDYSTGIRSLLRSLRQTRLAVVLSRKYHSRSLSLRRQEEFYNVALADLLTKSALCHSTVFKETFISPGPSTRTITDTICSCNGEIYGVISWTLDGNKTVQCNTGQKAPMVITTATASPSWQLGFYTSYPGRNGQACYLDQPLTQPGYKLSGDTTQTCINMPWTGDVYPIGYVCSMSLEFPAVVTQLSYPPILLHHSIPEEAALTLDSHSNYVSLANDDKCITIFLSACLTSTPSDMPGWQKYAGQTNCGKGVGCGSLLPGYGYHAYEVNPNSLSTRMGMLTTTGH